MTSGWRVYSLIFTGITVCIFYGIQLENLIKTSNVLIMQINQRVCFRCQLCIIYDTICIIVYKDYIPFRFGLQLDGEIQLYLQFHISIDSSIITAPSTEK